MTVTDIGVTDQGKPYIVLRSPRGTIRELIITVQATKPAEWLYGYVIRDHDSKTMVTYNGPHGDPELDMPGRLVGFE